MHLLKGMQGHCVQRRGRKFKKNCQGTEHCVLHISLCRRNCVRAQMLSCVWLFVTPRTVACQAPLSMGFPKQGYCSELPFPGSRGIFLTRDHTRILLNLLHWQVGFFTTSTTWEAPWKKIENTFYSVYICLEYLWKNSQGAGNMDAYRNPEGERHIFHCDPL